VPLSLTLTGKAEEDLNVDHHFCNTSSKEKSCLLEIENLAPAVLIASVFVFLINKPIIAD